MNKTSVLLVNLGTPDSPNVKDVRKYLSQFLNDHRVIDIPWLIRKILVNAIIVPFRAPKSAVIYKQLWTETGSPLLAHGLAVQQKLQQQLGDAYDVDLAMRYQNPSVESVLEKIRKKNPNKIVIIPLYPHYASSSTGSIVERVMEIMKDWYVIPEVRIVGQYYDHPKLIETIASRASEFNLADYDHILFSYHGLPVRQVDKVYDEGLCSDHNCENKITEENKYCYKATCYETTRLIAKAIGITQEQYSVGFQSRLDKNWLEPFSDKIIENLGQKGFKKLLVFSPAFVADCLETTVEIGSEYTELFKANGGQQLDLVPSLNDHPLWIEALKDLVIKQ